MFGWFLVAVYSAAAATQCVCLALTIRQYRISLSGESDGDSGTRSVVVYGESGIGETCLIFNAAHLFAPDLKAQQIGDHSLV